MDDQDKAYLIAVRHIGELSLHVRKLESELAELRRRDERVAADADKETDRLWLALAQITCDCAPSDEKQVEVFVLPLDHEEGCKYRDWYATIRGAVDAKI